MAILGSVGCSGGAPESGPGVTQQPFGTVEGKPVSVYTLRNAKGMEARVINYGGVILSLKVPDKAGKLGDVVLGFDSLAPYIDKSPYFGALIGRYGNRIANARFTIDSQTYQLAANNGPNNLHGGPKGFDKQVWQAQPFDSGSARGLTLTYLSPDGDQGFPGNLRAVVRYTLTDDNELIFDYKATTDKATPVNLTQHSYFNLAGDGTRDILDHVVTIDASRFTPVDTTLIPTGELKSVDGTPFDFRKPTAIGARIGQPDQQLKFGGGYDHNWVLDKPANATGPVLAARVYEPTTGRVMEILTTEPGLQFYSGNFLDGTLHGKNGAVYKHRYGFAMETQHFPDSPNHPQFPSTILAPMTQYHTTTIYRFSVQK